MMLKVRVENAIDTWVSEMKIELKSYILSDTDIIHENLPPINVAPYAPSVPNNIA